MLFVKDVRKKLNEFAGEKLADYESKLVEEFLNREVKKMKVYISGKITGDADYKQKFKTAQNILESAGFEVFNPAEQEDTGKSWTWYMRKDIAGLIECDAIFLLKDWEDSKGARLEYYIAQQLEMKIFREVEK